ncbi:MAG: HRDC domain-containing protein [Methanobacteriaceae archaeon]|nr:HRDC domain-containing protein [Methanobacteriaceae archaeon]
MSYEKNLNKPADVNPAVNNYNKKLKEYSKSQIEVKSRKKKNKHLVLDSEIEQLESSNYRLKSKEVGFNKLIKEYELSISKIIIYCINESTLLLDKSEVLSILKGKKSKKILTLALDELSTYSALSHCCEEWLKNFIAELISQNYLQIKYNSGKELLALNEKSLQLLSPNIPGKTEKPENDSFVYDEELYEKLRKLRNELAAKNNFAPYIICNNSTLKEMAMKMPKNDESMIKIRGVGVKFLENHGLAFQKVIKDHGHEISED